MQNDDEKIPYIQEYTPCVVDGLMLSICYLTFVILGSVRLGQLCDKTRMEYYRQKKRSCCFSHLQATLAFVVTLLYLFDLVKGLLPSSIGDIGDVYASENPAPFQTVTGLLGFMGWMVRALLLLYPPYPPQFKYATTH